MHKQKIIFNKIQYVRLHVKFLIPEQSGKSFFYSKENIHMEESALSIRLINKYSNRLLVSSIKNISLLNKTRYKNYFFLRYQKHYELQVTGKVHEIHQYGATPQRGVRSLWNFWSSRLCEADLFRLICSPTSRPGKCRDCHFRRPSNNPAQGNGTGIGSIQRKNPAKPGKKG